MTLEEKDQTFLAAAKEALDQSVRTLDARTLTRLRQARRRALEARPRQVPRLVWAGGFATISVALLAGALWLYRPVSNDTFSGLEDLELLTSVENLEVYEDLEFYGWLAETGSAG